MDADFEQLTFPDMEFSIPRDRDEFERRLLERFPAEARGIRRYIRFLEQADRMTELRLEEPALRTLWTLLRSPLLLRYANSTFGRFMDSCTKDPRLRSIMASQHGTYTVAPGEVSSVLHAGLQNHYFTNGGWYPEGGAQVVADRLADAVEDRGGQIRLRSHVEKIDVKDGAVCGVTFSNKHLGRRQVGAGLVISNADLKRTVFELVGSDNFPAAYAERVRGFEMALPLFVVYLGLDIPADRLPYGNVNRWSFGNYDFDGEYAQLKAGSISEHPFIYIATASCKDPGNSKLAPPGHTNMQVMTAVPSSPQFWGVTEEQIRDGSYQASEQYRATKERVTAMVLEEAERLVPGLREHVVFCESATPMTHTRYTGSTAGTSYGIAATPAQFLTKRPGARTPIKGLLMAGASMRSGHGIAGSMLSGVHAARETLGENPLRRAK